LSKPGGGTAGGGTTSAPCPTPKGTADLPIDNDVEASAVNDGQTTTYELVSNDQDAANGVPGLVKYCVYPTGANHAPAVAVTAKGGEAEDIDWTKTTSSKSPYTFSFQRAGGNATNIWFDEDNETTEMGTATWTGAVPTSQKLVLHVADPSLCGTSPTCFVKPNPNTGPICDAGTGNTGAAYNVIPTDFPECFRAPSFAFEGNFAGEFGDGVVLDTTAGTTLKSVTVDFQSYGCGTSGHWNTAIDGDPNEPGDQADPCVTAPNQTFTVPGGITARIYALPNGGGFDTNAEVGPEIATATINPDIPFRPSADPTCTGAEAGKFVGPNGVCVNSLPVLLTFNFQDEQLAPGQEVIWTVSFDTSNAGYAPIGNGTECRSTSGVPPVPTKPGCGYDSLNVGTYTYPGAPYAGTNPNGNEWFVNYSGDNATPLTPAGLLAETGGTCDGCGPGGADLGPADLTPLAQIVTGTP
jgi:hypothetical protein